MSGRSDLRVFTIEEANRSLPALRRALPDLRRLRRDIERVEDRLAILDLICNRTVSAGNPDLREFLGLKTKFHRRIEKFELRLAELEGEGFLIRSLDDGIVHFVARRQGESVLLCWKEGESEIGHWHALDDGSADEDGRKDIGAHWPEG